MTNKPKIAQFNFYAVKNANFMGGYQAESFTEGKAILMFSMDFFTTLLQDTPPEQRTAEWKDGMLEILMHEFGHAMQEMLDMEFTEDDVNEIMEKYNPNWNRL